MKKEYLILIVLILLLGAYLLFHKENKKTYTLPEIIKIDISKITGLVLNKKQEQIKFTKKDNTWVLTDNKYLADSSSIEDMLDTLKTLKLTTLVSQKGDLKRYELDEENRINVQVLEGEKTILEFVVGKPAPTFNHTFIMLADNKDVFHANGSFRSYFNKTLEDFRDKKVLEFQEESIKRFTIEKGDLSKTLILTQTKKEKDKENEKALISWNFEDGTSADKKMVSSLLSSISFIECEKYLDSPTKDVLQKENPLWKISLENGENIDLMLFETKEENIFKAISSMNDHVFKLSQFNGQEIVSNIEKLLGIIQE